MCVQNRRFSFFCLGPNLKSEDSRVALIIFLGLNNRVGQMVIVLPMGVVYEDSIIQYALSSSNRPKGAIFKLASEARLGPKQSE